MSEILQRLELMYGRCVWGDNTPEIIVAHVKETTHIYRTSDGQRLFDWVNIQKHTILYTDETSIRRDVVVLVWNNENEITYYTVSSGEYHAISEYAKRIGLAVIEPIAQRYRLHLDRKMQFLAKGAKGYTVITQDLDMLIPLQNKNEKILYGYNGDIVTEYIDGVSTIKSIIYSHTGEVKAQLPYSIRYSHWLLTNDVYVGYGWALKESSILINADNLTIMYQSPSNYELLYRALLLVATSLTKDAATVDLVYSKELRRMLPIGDFFDKIQIAKIDNIPTKIGIYKNNIWVITNNKTNRYIGKVQEAKQNKIIL